MATRSSLPKRYFWTWDHSTNWQPGVHAVQTHGSCRPYLKDAGAFLDDYKRLVDFMAEHQLNGLIIWGFLRDAHGGETAALELCEYAQRNSVKIIPGVGVTAYGGVYYEGEHRYNMGTWCRSHPELAVRGVDLREPTLCPSREENLAWAADGIRWLLDTFPIGGVNIETGDYGVCECAECRSARAAGAYRSAEGRFSLDDVSRFLAPLLEELLPAAGGRDLIYATYTDYGEAFPAQVLAGMPEEAACQWNISGMITPGDGFARNRFYRKGEPIRRPPARRNLAYIHHGSQWYLQTRDEPVPLSIRRGVEIAAQAEMEGVILHGEVSAESIPNLINYLAFAYFSHDPAASLQGFAETCLAPRLAEPGKAGDYWNLLSADDADTFACLRYFDADPSVNDDPWWQWLKKHLMRREFVSRPR